MATSITLLGPSPSGENTHGQVSGKVDEISPFIATNKVAVYSEADFPAIDGNGYHVLEANTVYELTGTIALTNPIDFGVAGNYSSIIAFSTGFGVIIYSGTNALFKSSGGNVETRLITCVHANAQLYDVNGAQDVIIKAPEAVFSGKGGGMAGGVLVADFEKTTMQFSDDPLQIDGTNINLLINQAAFLCETATACLDLRNGTYVNIRIENSQFSFGAAGFGIRSQANSSNIGDIAILSTNDFIGAGTPLENITNTDAKWVINSNAPVSAVPNTEYSGTCFIAPADDQSTPINTINTPVKVAGLYTVGNQKQFQVQTDGRITYTGLRQITKRIIAKFNADPASGSNITYNFYIAMNGVIELASFSTVTVDASNPTMVICVGDFDVSTNDYFEIFVECTSTTAVTCSGLSFLI
jgi:hypothetical protein